MINFKIKKLIPELLKAIFIRLFLAITLSLSFSISAFSQNWLWAKSSVGNGIDQAYSVSADSGGNVFAAGGFSSLTISFGASSLINASTNLDIFIVKYDDSGNVLWARSAGGSGDDYAYSVYADAGGNVLITGSFSSSTISFGSTTLINSGGEDIFLAKYDASGNLLWAKSAGGTDGDKGNSVITDAGGNVFITGYFASQTIPFGSVILNNTNLSYRNFFLAKYDPAGNIIWAKSAGADYGTYGSSVTIDPGGNVLLLGYFNGSFTLGAFTLTSGDIFTAKFDIAGNVLWVKSPVGGGQNYGNSISADAGGNIFITGSFPNSITFGSTTLTSANGNFDVFLTKYDSNGNVLWAKSGGGTDIDEGYSVKADACGNIFLIGYFGSPTITFGSILLTHPLNCIDLWDAVFIVKYDASGNVLGGSSLASGGNDQNGLTTDPFGNVFIGGGNSKNQFIIGLDTLVKSGGKDVFTAKYNLNNMTASVSFNPAVCNGTCTGTATATVTPLNCFGPFTYSWNTIPVQTTQTATGLCAGDYIVTIINSSNSAGTASVTIPQPAPLSINSSSTAAVCGTQNGTATVIPTGGTAGYSFSWNHSSQTTQTITGLPAGNDTATVTDTNGCIQTEIVTVPSTSISLNAVSSPTGCITSIGTATANPTTGTPPFAFVWSTGQTDQTIIGLGLGTYTVTVTDSNLCIQTQAVECKINDDFTVPNAFSPNNDGHNDVLILQGWENCVTEFTFSIYDRWGEKVFESFDPVKGWDGSFNGKIMDPDVFVYYINGTVSNGEKIAKKGNISLIR